MKKYICTLIVSVLLTASLGVSAKSAELAVWQDPQNIVVISPKEGAEYSFFRSDTIDGEYELMCQSDGASFRDDSARYPDTYFYKVAVSDESGNEIYLSPPVKADIYPQMLSKVSVIMYHNFITEEDVASGVEFDEYSIRPEDFEEDLIWLRNNGYTTITSHDLIEHLEGKKSLPHKAVIISIDDGSLGVYTNAYPLLKKYNMKADFNIIGKNIDSTWDNLDSGGTRAGESAPYCTWEELIEMSQSGEINLCSHTYGLHVYDRDGRIGMRMMAGESAEDFARVVKRDYELSVKCIEGWTGKTPETVAYPYSKRSEEGDRIVLENTGYKILMAGEGARGTASNYFVRGCDISQQYRLISRPCRMEGTPIGTYIEAIDEKDNQNGVNKKADYLTLLNTDEIASDYQIFDDVKPKEWYSGSVYYAYLNGLMNGVSAGEFAPYNHINRAMTATLLCRLTSDTAGNSDVKFGDSSGSEWWYDSASRAVENGILTARDGNFKPNEPISRQELAQAMYNCGEYLGLDMSAKADITSFTDCSDVSTENTDAVSWSVAQGIFQGNSEGGFNPRGNVTRAEMSMVLRNWLSKGE